MKYNKLKNLLQGITTATIYSAYIPDNIPGLAKVIGIIAVFASVTMSMNEMDRIYLKKSASVGRP